MTYNKPEVIRLDNAVNSIQGVMKAQTFVDNGRPWDRYATVGAYEADE